MEKTHHYAVQVTWTGNRGSGTTDYRAYGRDHISRAGDKPEIPGSSDPGFRGDKSRYNPEELLVTSLATCHMLWYLHCCAEAGVVVTGYVDHAAGTMTETAGGGGYFSEVTLHPEVVVASPAMIGKANALHEKANRLCFVANSVKFPVHHQAVCVSE